MSSLIQVSDPNAVIYISSTAYFGQLRTIRDTSGTRSSNNTITVVATDLTFSDGTTEKILDTPYASITIDSSARVMHAFPFTYGGSADAQGLTIQGGLSVTDSMSVYDSFFSSNTISSIGSIDAQSIQIGTTSILTIPILVNAVESLGQNYTSSIFIPINSLRSNYLFSNELTSTVVGLREFYVSSGSIQSTVAGLGT